MNIFLQQAFGIEKRLNRKLKRNLKRFKESVNERFKDVVSSIKSIASSKQYTNNNVGNLRNDLNRLDENVIGMVSEVRNCARNIESVVINVQEFETKVKSIAEDVHKDDEELFIVIHDVEHVKENIRDLGQTIQALTDNHHELNKTCGLVYGVDKSVCDVYTTCKTVPEGSVYNIKSEFMKTPVPVYCDQDTDGGEWAVIMRRKDGSEPFTRSWSDYKKGFGNRTGEFWAGNDMMHELTKSKPVTLRIDMEDFNGKKAFSEYDGFQVGPEADKYRLKVFRYSGTAGDSLIETGKGSRIHDGQQFTTFDSDNDNMPSGNCAIDYPGGWWLDI